LVGGYIIFTMKFETFQSTFSHHHFDKTSKTFRHEDEKERGEWVHFPDASRREKVLEGESLMRMEKNVEEVKFITH
jgi:hypothetical protein